jgi:hypothetical protein
VLQFKTKSVNYQGKLYDAQDLSTQLYANKVPVIDPNTGKAGNWLNIARHVCTNYDQVLKVSSDPNATKNAANALVANHVIKYYQSQADAKIQ